MKEKIRFSINIVIVLLVLAGWTLCFLTVGGALSSSGFENLKYFTVLSNLFEGLISLLWIVVWLVNKGKIGRWLECLKYVATSAVFVTFTVVLVFLGPAYGMGNMYRGANLFFHLLVPIFAVLESVVLSETDFTWRANLFCMIPPFAYGVGYLVNILVNGVGVWPNTNDFYAFLTWGYPVGILIFACIVALSFVLGLAVRLLRKNIAEGFKREKKAEKSK